jgi:hypothetical protein
MFVNANINSLCRIEDEDFLYQYLRPEREYLPVYSLHWNQRDILRGCSRVGPIRHNPIVASLPLSKGRQMTSIPASAANPMGKRSSTFSPRRHSDRARTSVTQQHVISNRVVSPIPIECTNGHWYNCMSPGHCRSQFLSSFAAPDPRILASLRHLPPRPVTAGGIQVQSSTKKESKERPTVNDVEAVMRHLLDAHHAGHQPDLQPLFHRIP